MLVTFQSKAWGSLTMFGDVAVRLLKMMGHSGTVPGALPAADIPAALARLERELAAVEAEEKVSHRTRTDDEDRDAPPSVKLSQRAYPLIQLLTAAARKECDVMWEEGNPMV